jgi:hypothetical protein
MLPTAVKDLLAKHLANSYGPTTLIRYSPVSSPTARSVLPCRPTFSLP